MRIRWSVGFWTTGKREKTRNRWSASETSPLTKKQYTSGCNTTKKYTQIVKAFVRKEIRTGGKQQNGSNFISEKDAEARLAICLLITLEE